ncbi:MAG: hypothetical protein U9R34_04945 [Nanoarchaeota archaeon]|nr:hypothetical protein [Nanoarchaeota archaeon]
MKNQFFDIVVSGPDMSGTGTQVNDLIDFFQQSGKIVKDIRGTEIDALFHTEIFKTFNSQYISLQQFLSDKQVSEDDKKEFVFQANQLMIGGNTNEDLKVASCIKNKVSTYINPDSADVWIMEEPTKRGAGQVNRALEQQRTQYLSSFDPIAAAYCHQVYRIDEFLRFRRVLREKNKIIIRSRSEESACYQIYDKDRIPDGIPMKDYLNLPGNKIAFGNPPTHLFIICAKDGWTREQYIAIKKERGNGRYVDDYETKINYQILLNERYRTSWLEDLYRQGCSMYGSAMPSISRLNIYDSKEEIKQKMCELIKNFL